MDVQTTEQAGLVTFQPGDGTLYTVGLAVLTDDASRRAAGFTGGSCPVYLFAFNHGRQDLHAMVTDACPMDPGYQASRMGIRDDYTMQAASLVWTYLIGCCPQWLVAPEDLGWESGWKEQLASLRAIVERAEAEAQG